MPILQRLRLCRKRGSNAGCRVGTRHLDYYAIVPGEIKSNDAALDTPAVVVFHNIGVMIPEEPCARQ